MSTPPILFALFTCPRLDRLPPGYFRQNRGVYYEIYPQKRFLSATAKFIRQLASNGVFYWYNTNIQPFFTFLNTSRDIQYNSYYCHC